jgi:CTP synthase
MVVARMDVAEAVKAPHIAQKLATFCGVRDDAVVLMPDARSVYEVPLNAVQGGVLAPLERFVDHGDPDMKQWEELVKAIESDPKEEVKIGLVAKYVDNTDTYLSVTEALKAAAWKVGVKLKTVWINAEEATDKDFAGVDGIVVPGGFGVRGVEGKIAAATYCLQHNKPYLGLCLGMQCAVIAAARLGGVKNANSEEFGAEEGENVVYIMEGQKGKESTGGTMRLGNYPAKLEKGSKLAKLYGTTEVVERHRHRYEVNQAFLEQIEKGGLKIAGTSPDGSLVEFVEAPKCDYFVATQGHPEYRSRPYRAHPMFEGLLRAAKKK